MHALNSTQIVFADKKNFNRLENTRSRDKSFTYAKFNVSRNDIRPINQPHLNYGGVKVVSLLLVVYYDLVTI